MAEEVLAGLEALARQLGVSDITPILRRIAERLSTDVGGPVSALRARLIGTVEAAKGLGDDLSAAATALPAELRALPDEAGVCSSVLTTDLPRAAGSLAAAASAAATEPSSLYPRFKCCGFAPGGAAGRRVDPTSVAKFASQHGALLSALDFAVGGAAASGGVAAPRSATSGGDGVAKAPPSSAAELVTTVTEDMAAVMAPLTAATAALTASRARLDNVSASVSATATVASSAVARLGDSAAVAAAALAAVATAVASSGTVTSAALRDASAAAAAVGEAAAPLHETVTAARGAAGELEAARGELGAVVDALAADGSALAARSGDAATRLPAAADALRQFLVPTGVRALVLAPADELTALTGAVEGVRSVLPTDAGDVRARLAAAPAVTRVAGLAAKAEGVAAEPAAVAAELADGRLAEQLAAALQAAVADATDELHALVAANAVAKAQAVANTAKQQLGSITGGLLGSFF
ncbi:hypothetical protein MMPV_004219 [Pyropia vietnamensis]